MAKLRRIRCWNCATTETCMDLPTPPQLGGRPRPHLPSTTARHRSPMDAPASTLSGGSRGGFASADNHPGRQASTWPGTMARAAAWPSASSTTARARSRHGRMRPRGTRWWTPRTRPRPSRYTTSMAKRIRNVCTDWVGITSASSGSRLLRGKSPRVRSRAVSQRAPRGASIWPSSTRTTTTDLTARRG